MGHKHSGPMHQLHLLLQLIVSFVSNIEVILGALSIWSQGLTSGLHTQTITTLSLNLNIVNTLTE